MDPPTASQPFLPYATSPRACRCAPPRTSADPAACQSSPSGLLQIPASPKTEPTATKRPSPAATRAVSRAARTRPWISARGTAFASLPLAAVMRTSRLSTSAARSSPPTTSVPVPETARARSEPGSRPRSAALVHSRPSALVCTA